MGILELKIIEIKIKNTVDLIIDFPVLSILLKQIGARKLYTLKYKVKN